MIKNIIILILILAFTAVVIFLDVPGVQSVLSLRKDINFQKQTFMDAQDMISRIGKLTDAYEENLESIEKTDYILPSSEEIATLNVQFEALAFEQGLLLEKIEFATIKQESNITGMESASGTQLAVRDYQILSVTTKLIGSYPALKNFLKAVEENMRLMDVNSITFSTPSEENPEIFEFNLNLNTYYQ